MEIPLLTRWWMMKDGEWSWAMKENEEGKGLGGKVKEGSEEGWWKMMAEKDGEGWWQGRAMVVKEDEGSRFKKNQEWEEDVDGGGIGWRWKMRVVH